MSIKIVTSFAVLMQKASALGRAKKLKDAIAIAIAQKDHDDYLELCRKSDEMCQ